MVRWVGLGMVALAVACGGSPRHGSGGPSLDRCDDAASRERDARVAVVTSAPPARDGDLPHCTELAVEPWWQRATGACPDGTELVGAPPPDGREVWCARPDGTKDGPYVSWYENGAILRTGRYRDGVRHGIWSVWSDSCAKLDEGAYLAGERKQTIRLRTDMTPPDDKPWGDPRKPTPTFPERDLAAPADTAGGTTNTGPGAQSR